MIIDPNYQNQLSTMHSWGQFVRGSKALKSVQPFIEHYPEWINDQLNGIWTDVPSIWTGKYKYVEVNHR